ncbi:hypothetical protein JCM11491_005756 [Sporobolomyces phaffii]
MTTPFAPLGDDKLVERLEAISHILLVLSGKGGVGKSSVSVQLALALRASDPNLRIGILDVDLTGPSLPRMLGLQDRDVLASRDGWVPVHLESDPALGGTGHLACMSIGFLLESTSESVVWRGPKKNAMIKQFLAQVAWGELDYLIVDTPPGTSDEHISLVEALRPLLVDRAPDAGLPSLSSVLVSTPQALALLDVSKELSFVRRTRLPLLGLVENMSGYVCPHCGDVVGVFGQGGGESFCARENARTDSQVEGEGGGCRFLGRVPIDRDLVALLDDVAEHGTAGIVGDNDGAERRIPGRRTLVERYRDIPSFKIVKGLAEDVKRLIDEQTASEEEARRRRHDSMQPLEQVTSNDSVASVDIGDYQFCVRHGNEACKDCQVDFKEDNSFTAGVDPVPQREAIHVDFTMNKEGEPICKSHKTADCKSCYNFKKQLVKLTKDGQKKAKQDKKNNPISNLFQ